MAMVPFSKAVWTFWKRKSFVLSLDVRCASSSLWCAGAYDCTHLWRELTLGLLWVGVSLPSELSGSS